MRKFISFTVLLTLLSINVSAQTTANSEELETLNDIPENMIWSIDSLLNDWKTKQYINLSSDCITAESNPYYPDSVYIERLARIPSIIELPYNDVIR